MTKEDYKKRINDTISTIKAMSVGMDRYLKEENPEVAYIKYDATVFRLFLRADDGTLEPLMVTRYKSADDILEPLVKAYDDDSKWLQGVKQDGWTFNDYVESVADMLYNITSNTELFPEGSYKLLWFGQDEED